MTLKNLETALANTGINMSFVADAIGATDYSLDAKIRENIPMTIDEMHVIHDRFLPWEDFADLCESDGDKPHTDAERVYHRVEAIGEALTDGREPAKEDAEAIKELHESAKYADPNFILQVTGGR